jgi:hypothetical protein
MDPAQRPEKNEESKTNAVLRHMGMSLSVLGVIVFAAGLVVCSQNSGESSFVPCVLMLASGIAMFVSGLYIWRIAKQTS